MGKSLEKMNFFAHATFCLTILKNQSENPPYIDHIDNILYYAISVNKVSGSR